MHHNAILIDFLRIFATRIIWYIRIVLLFDISFVHKAICSWKWMWETIMKNLPFLAITNDTDLPIIKNVLIIIKSISGNNERCKTSPFQFFEWCGFTKKYISVMSKNVKKRWETKHQSHRQWKTDFYSYLRIIISPLF